MGKASLFSKVMRASYVTSIMLGLFLLALGGLLRSVAYATPAAQTSGHVDVATFKLAITPVSAQYYDRLISTAENDGASALIIEINTPGGLVDSMQTMVQRTLASRVPVIAYIYPQGAMAASAGIFLMYSSHLAAMAPNTTIGSAEVILNSGDSSSASSTPETSDAAAERRKVTNLLVSQIRSLADERGRNADFGEQAIRQSANLPAKDAVQQRVVDILASDVQDLLNQADGRTVKVNGQNVTLRTKDAAINNLSTNFTEDLLILITDPNVAFVLISLGTLGLTWEFINPGAVFPGVVGAILLLVGFLALGTLPINWSGVVFIALAFVLFIADVFMPTHGILTAGGIASLVLGGLLLINTGGVGGVPTVSPYVVFGTAAGLGLFFFFAIYKVVMARRRQPTTGREALVGRIAQARTDLSPEGMVFMEGELWHALSMDGTIISGQEVRVVGSDGLLLKVLPAGDGIDTRKL